MPDEQIAQIAEDMAIRGQDSWDHVVEVDDLGQVVRGREIIEAARRLGWHSVSCMLVIVW
jgi:hypothetical protein